MKIQNVDPRAGSTEKLQNCRQAVDRPGRSIKGGKDQFRAIYDGATINVQNPIAEFTHNTTVRQVLSGKSCARRHQFTDAEGLAIR